MLDNPQESQLLIWGIIIVVSIVGLVVLMKILGAAARSRIHNTKAESMSFDDLGRMQQTGLLTEEEMKRIKQRMAEKMLEQATPRPKESKPGGEAALRSLMLDIEARGKEALAEPEAPASPQMPREKPPAEAPAAPPMPSPGASAAETPPPPQKTSPEKQMFDLEKLLASGAIDRAEYDRLRDYFSKK